MSFTPPTTEPKPDPFVSFSESSLQNAPERIGFTGLPGSGKSHALLSLFDALRDRLNVAPADATVFVLDLDNGLAKLVRRGLIPADYRQSIRYSNPTSWDGVTDAMDKILEEAPALIEKNGPNSTWLLIDNVYKSYRWARDQYSIDVFGMSEIDRAKLQRRKALANPENKRGVLPTFDQQIDYGTITPLYLTQFWDPIMFSGVNLLITFPTYERWSKDSPPKLETLDYRCQAQIEHDLDDIVWFRTPPGNPESHLASLRKSRTVPSNKLFRDVPDVTMSRLLNLFDKHRDGEA